MKASVLGGGYPSTLAIRSVDWFLQAVKKNQLLVNLNKSNITTNFYVVKKSS
ncbi:MAG: hypothetical protein JWN45_2412, partial [Acidobacteriaceae bacterium]|nr:hypothetical protein [Acidobacteriaceae bacterium]